LIGRAPCANARIGTSATTISASSVSRILSSYS
jgi:hypothetical protein